MLLNADTGTREHRDYRAHATAGIGSFGRRNRPTVGYDGVFKNSRPAGRPGGTARKWTIRSREESHVFGLEIAFPGIHYQRMVEHYE